MSQAIAGIAPVEDAEVTVMTGFYLGRRSYERDLEEGRIFLSGDQRLVRTFRNWLKFSMHSHSEGIAQVAEHADLS